MHEPFQRGEPVLPCHSPHDTSSYSPSIARRPEGKKACGAPVRSHRSKLHLALLSAYHDPIGKGKNALHLYAELVLRMGDRLVTPMWVRRLWHWVIKTQIIDLYNDGLTERARKIGGKRVFCWGYLEAAPASVTETVVRTECKLVDRSREPRRKIYAARCRRMSCSAWVTWRTKSRK
jgi:hypothetical protein